MQNESALSIERRHSPQNIQTQKRLTENELISPKRKPLQDIEKRSGDKQEWCESMKSNGLERAPTSRSGQEHHTKHTDTGYTERDNRG